MSLQQHMEPAIAKIRFFLYVFFIFYIVFFIFYIIDMSLQHMEPATAKTRFFFFDCCMYVYIYMFGYNCFFPSKTAYGARHRQNLVFFLYFYIFVCMYIYIYICLATIVFFLLKRFFCHTSFPFPCCYTRRCSEMLWRD